MSNRFHNKFHRQNHHSDPTVGYPDSAFDPIASFEQPFKGEFYSQGDIITTQNLSAGINLNVTNNANIFGTSVRTPNIGTGEDNSVVILNSSGYLKTDEINPGVWDTTMKFVTASDGALTVNRLTKATDSTGINESIVFDNGTNVGIGTDTPGAKLDVNGSAIIRTDLTVNGDFTVLGTTSQLDTLVYTTSAVSITNAGTGPALTVTQTGSQPIAHFIDSNGDDIIFADNGYVGLGVASPSEKLTISGNLSSSGTATIGTIATNAIGTSVVIETAGLIQKRTLNVAAFDTTSKFVSASDGDLNAGYIPKATNATGLDKSLIYDDGTNVGINEASPKGKFHVKAGSSGTTAVEPNSIGIFENSGNSYISILSPTAQYAGVVMGGPTNPYGSYVSWNHDNLALKVATNHAGGSIQMLVGDEQEAVRIASTGNVGIGTTSPSEKLTVSGNLSTSGTATIGTIAVNATGTSVVIESNGLLQKRTLNVAALNTVSRFVSASDGDLTVNRLQKATNSNGINESIVFDDGTNVGIGTDVPTEKLQVQGNAKITGTVETANIGTGEDNSVVILDATGKLRTDEINPQVWDTTAKFVSASDGVLSVNYLSKATNSNGINESIIYDDGTNIGIGETAPEGKLHVKAGSSGSATAQPNSIGIFENSGNSYISVLSPNSQYAGLVMGGPGNPYGSYVSWNHDNSALKVATAHSGGAIQLLVNAEQEAVRILSGGNVGIGTTNPREKLTISGNLSSSGTATIGTIPTNDINTSFVVESNGLLQKRTLNIAAGNTVARFVSASDGALSINHLTKATNSNGINESIISDDGISAYVGGNLTISGNLTALGNSYFLNTLFTTTSAISVVNTGPGPALYVYQGPGTSDVASFYDGDGIEVLHIGNCDPGDQFGKIGVNTGSPNKELTVKGSVSASGTMNLGTVDTNASSTSFLVLGTDNILQKRSINSAATNTTSRFVSASDGNLSVNYLTKATNSNGINESIVYDDGTRVGIGTNTPQCSLEIVGGIRVRGGVPGANGVNNNGYSFTHPGDNDSGMYSSSDGCLEFHSNSAEVMRVNSNGFVGIGTASPSEKLDISGNLKTSGTATIGALATGTSDSILIESSGLVQKRTIDSRAWGSSLVDGTGTANYVTKWSDANTVTNSIVFDNGTNVGIGTTSPGVKLDVAGTAAVDYLRVDAQDGINEGGEISLVGAGSYGNVQLDNFQGNLRLHTLGTGNNFQIIGGGSTTALRVENGGAFIGKLDAGTTNSVIIESSGTLQKRSIDSRAWGSSLVDGSGTTNYVAKWTDADTITNSQIFDNGTNVGVGTASPGVKLDVNGVIRSNNEIIGSGLGGSGQARYISGNYGVIHRNDGSDYYILKTASGDQYGGWDTSRPFVVNLATGNVGIGSTADISHKLSVTGNIKSSNVIIPGSSTVTPAATTALPASNDVILNNQIGPVTITAFSNGVAGVTYTITNKSTHAVTLDTSASLFVRGGNSWASHKCTTNSEGYIVLPQNFSCSLRMDSATIGSAW